MSIISMRREFVMLASQEGANRRELCRRDGISPTGYKWLLHADPKESYANRSRRSLLSPARNAATINSFQVQFQPAESHQALQPQHC